jgi:hypothetical protein
MIVGVWVLKPGIRYQDLRQRVQERLLKYPRFVQCAVEDAAGASWAADQTFDLDNHLIIEKTAAQTRWTRAGSPARPFGGADHAAAGQTASPVAVSFG